MSEYYIIFVFLFVGTLFAGGGIATAFLLAPRGKQTLLKLMPYECGEEAIGDARIQFKVGYYLFALLFLIFDVEALFLFPCVILLSRVANGSIPGISAMLILVEVGIFLVILSLGLFYAWRKGALQWE